MDRGPGAQDVRNEPRRTVPEENMGVGGDVCHAAISVRLGGYERDAGAMSGYDREWDVEPRNLSGGPARPVP